MKKHITEENIIETITDLSNGAAAFLSVFVYDKPEDNDYNAFVLPFNIDGPLDEGVITQFQEHISELINNLKTNNKLNENSSAGTFAMLPQLEEAETLSKATAEIFEQNNINLVAILASNRETSTNLLTS